MGILAMKCLGLWKTMAATATVVVMTAGRTAAAEASMGFDPKTDLISLHYDHAPDRDDGHSAAADRTMLESLYGGPWVIEHTVAVSGAYGKNQPKFNSKSDAVMDAAWGDRGGWIAADKDRDAAVKALYERWMKTLEAGGDVYVKEGGQSDITALVVQRINAEHADIDTTQRIHVVQHSNWNEKNCTGALLAYAKKHTDYVNIKDANRYLNEKGGDKAFEKAALEHPVFGPSWQAAFAYYPIERRLDFSDTGELMHILDLGELNIEQFRKRFLEAEQGG